MIQRSAFCSSHFCVTRNLLIKLWTGRVEAKNKAREHTIRRIKNQIPLVLFSLFSQFIWEQNVLIFGEYIL
uniref:Transposase n=1 Tax=Caenorhabditis tropicalis TaxID=1561998 RepID=A0A1I7T596_9PELO